MDPDELKAEAARTAISHIPEGSIVGVGTGSTVNHFIDGLSGIRERIRGAVSSSEASTERLRATGIDVWELNDVDDLPVYIDGADEINRHLQMIKGGGGALTREKIVAAVAKQFVCIADASKRVDMLGGFPVPVEVIPMARSYVARELVGLGGQPELRRGFITDNGNVILDVHNLTITKPIEMERTINNIAGVVTVGIFAQRRADVLLLATDNGVETITA